MHFLLIIIFNAQMRVIPFLVEQESEKTLDTTQTNHPSEPLSMVLQPGRFQAPHNTLIELDNPSTTFKLSLSSLFSRKPDTI